jgi:hypothetical protein
MPGDTGRNPGDVIGNQGLFRLRRCAVGGLMGGMLIGGCARPAVVPPTASIPQRPLVALSPSIEPLPAERIGPAVPIPEIGDVQWPTDATPRDWNYLVLHHTATTQGSVESIHETHLKKKDSNGNPWQGIGYHFVIGNGAGMNDGEIEPTFRWRQQLAGAHAGVNEYNQHGIGIVLVGNFEKQSPTAAQLRAVRRLVGTLSRRFQIPQDHVVGHGDVKATECPGQYFPLDDVRSSAIALNRDPQPTIAMGFRRIPATDHFSLRSREQ